MYNCIQSQSSFFVSYCGCLWISRIEPFNCDFILFQWDKKKKSRWWTYLDKVCCCSAQSPAPTLTGANVCVKILSWQCLLSLYLCVILTQNTENCNFHFPNTAGRFLYTPPTAANHVLVNNKKNQWSKDVSCHIGPGRRTLSFRILCLHHGAGWHNGLLQGALKQLAIKWFEGVLLGCCERLQVWNACFQEHWTKCMVAFSTPLVLPEEEEGGLRGKQGHSRAICYSASECRALSSPQSLCGWWGGQIEMAQTAPCTMVDQERGRENEARENGRLNEGKTAWLLIVGKCVPGVKRVHGLL